MGLNSLLGTYKIIRRPGASNFTLALAFQGVAIFIIIRETENQVVNTRTWVQIKTPSVLYYYVWAKLCYN